MVCILFINFEKIYDEAFGPVPYYGTVNAGYNK